MCFLSSGAGLRWGWYFLAGVDGLEGVCLESICLYHSYVREKKRADEFDEVWCSIFFIDKRCCVVIMYIRATEERTRHWTAKDIIKRL